MSLVAWGLLGTARINRRLIPAIQADPRSRVVAVASRDGARANAYAREWNIPHGIAGYDRLLERDDVSAVYIPLPNSLHVEWTLRAVAAGKHVLCEKPMALDPSDVDLVAQAAAEADVVVEEGFMYRHEPLTTRVLELVAGGAVGSVRAISSGFTYMQNRPHDVRLERSLGGGALLDVGCYPVSYACLLMGRETDAATGLARWTAGSVDEEFAGVLRYRGGATASIYAGFRAAPRTWLDIAGSEGSMAVPNPFKPGPSECISLERLGERHAIEVRGSALLFERQVAHFVAAVLDGAPVTIPLSESRRVSAALFALDAAARAHEARS